MHEELWIAVLPAMIAVLLFFGTLRIGRDREPAWGAKPPLQQTSRGAPGEADESSGMMQPGVVAADDSLGGRPGGCSPAVTATRSSGHSGCSDGGLTMSSFTGSTCIGASSKPIP